MKDKLLIMIFSALLLLSWNSYAHTGKKVVTLNFDAPGEPFTLHGGVITTAKGEVIAGKGSLLADSRGKQKKWFEYFTTNAGLLEGNYTYRIRFSYKVLAADKGAIFYSLLRSKIKGWGKYDRGWNRIKNITVGVGEVNYQVGIGDLDDYELRLGIRGNAEIVVDNLVIEQLDSFSEPTELEKIQSRISKQAKKVMVVDFESSKSVPIEFIQGRPSTAKTDLIAGKISVIVDTLTGSKTWNNVLKTKPGILKKGFRYYVTLKYKMHNKTATAKVYMLARSKTFGAGIMDRGMRSSSGDKGETRTAFTIFDIWDADDYCLEIGIKGKAKVSIDDIIIYRENLGVRKIVTRKPLDKKMAKLVFNEEFNGKKINQKLWNIEGDQERRGGLWLKKNVYLDGKGNLVLKFDKDKKSGKFAMGAITTEGKFTVKYGYIEARMKVGKAVGHWPGIWLTTKGTNKVGNMGRDGTEIDIVELPWRHKDEVSHGMHWNGYREDHSTVSNHVKVPGINQGWHTFAVDWSPDGYIFFVDGKETWRSDAGDVCRVPLYLLISDELGGWSGNPKQAKSLPDFIYVDYIKVWQK